MKRTRKLALNRETVAVLSSRRLRTVAGGISAYPPCDTAGNLSCYMEVCANSWFPSACSGGVPCPGSGYVC